MEACNFYSSSTRVKFLNLCNGCCLPFLLQLLKLEHIPAACMFQFLTSNSLDEIKTLWILARRL